MAAATTREVELVVSFPAGGLKGTRTLIRSRVSMHIDDTGDNLRKKVAQVVAAHELGKTQINSEVQGSSILFCGRKTRWDQYTETVRKEVVPFTGELPRALHVHVPRLVNLNFTFVQWPPYETRMAKDRVVKGVQTKVVGRGMTTVSIEATPDEIRSMLAAKFGFDASFLIHAGRQIPLYGKDEALFFLYGAPLLVRLGAKDDSTIYAFTDREGVSIRSNNRERRLVSGWFGRGDDDESALAESTVATPSSAARVRRGSDATPIRTNSAPMKRSPVTNPRTPTTNNAATRLLESVTTVKPGHSKNARGDVVRKCHRLTAAECLLPSYAVRLKLALRHGTAGASLGVSRLLFGGLDLTSTPRSPGHFGAQAGSSVWFVEDSRANLVNLTLKLKPPNATRHATLQTLDLSVARSTVFGELAVHVEHELNPSGTHSATIVFGGRTYGRRAGNADVPIADHGVESGTTLFCVWNESLPGERQITPLQNATPATPQQIVDNNKQRFKYETPNGLAAKPNPDNTSGVDSADPSFSTVESTEPPLGAWEVADDDWVWTPLPERLAVDIESAFARGEPRFKFQARGRKHQLDFHSAPNHGAPHSLSIVGSTKELRVMRTAGDSIVIQRWEFYDSSLTMFCPLPAAASEAISTCVQNRGSMCRYTVNGAVFTATPGENGEVSDYNENNGSTRELRSVTLSVGTRVKLPGYDRLPGATGTVAYLGPEKIAGKKRPILAGVTLDDAVGWNHGTVGGAFYFQCQLHHGVLCDPSAVLIE